MASQKMTDPGSPPQERDALRDFAERQPSAARSRRAAHGVAEGGEMTVPWRGKRDKASRNAKARLPGNVMGALGE
jgi:hypothetical protein